MKLRTVIKWGIFLGIAQVLGTQILTWIGLGLTSWFIVMVHALIVGFVIFSLNDFKKDADSNFNYLNAGLLAAGAILIASVIFQIYMFIYINYVDPLWVETTSVVYADTLKNKNLTQEQIESSIKSFQNSYKTLNMFTSGLFFNAIPFMIEGVIVSALYVLINKKRNRSNKINDLAS